MEKRTAGVEIKQKNRTSIFQLLRRHEGLSRQDIVTMLRLSLPTVTQNLVELMEEGIVEECGSIGNTGGRRAKSYAINCQARVAIGLDITKNHISVAVVDMIAAYHGIDRSMEFNTAQFRTGKLPVCINMMNLIPLDQ